MTNKSTLAGVPHSIVWTQTLLKELKAAHALAVANKQENFSFFGRPMYTKFAGYLIEYLDGQLNPK